MITDRPKFTTKWSPYRMFNFHFTVRINSKSFLWTVRSVQETYFSSFHIIGNVRFSLLGKPRTPLCYLAADIKEKQNELETKNK